MLRKEYYNYILLFTFPGWPSFQRDLRNSSNSPASIKPFPRKWNHNAGIKPWPNEVVSRRKLYLHATPFGQVLRALALTCDDLGSLWSR